MHQNSPYWEPLSKKILGGSPLPTPYPLGAFGASILAPAALDLVACGASSSPTYAVVNWPLKSLVFNGAVNTLSSEFWSAVWTHKNYSRRMIVLGGGKNLDGNIQCFHIITGQTDRQTDRETDGRTDGQEWYNNIALYMPVHVDTW